MYLILPTSEAEQRNSLEATKRGCGNVTLFWWSQITVEGETSLNVGDGDGLTEIELTQTVNELPAKFIPQDELS